MSRVPRRPARALRAGVGVFALLLGTLVLSQPGSASAGPPRPVRIQVDAVTSSIAAPAGTPTSAIPSALVVAGQPFSVTVSFYDENNQPIGFSQDTVLAISTSAGSTNLPVPATGIAEAGDPTATLTTTLERTGQPGLRHGQRTRSQGTEGGRPGHLDGPAALRRPVLAPLPEQRARHAVHRRRRGLERLHRRHADGAGVRRGEAAARRGELVGAAVHRTLRQGLRPVRQRPRLGDPVPRRPRDALRRAEPAGLGAGPLRQDPLRRRSRSRSWGSATP